MKDTQVEVSKPDLAPAFFLHFGARDPVTDAFGSRDHSTGQSGHSLPLAPLLPPIPGALRAHSAPSLVSRLEDLFFDSAVRFGWPPCPSH